MRNVWESGTRVARCDFHENLRAGAIFTSRSQTAQIDNLLVERMAREIAPASASLRRNCEIFVGYAFRCAVKYVESMRLEPLACSNRKESQFAIK